jgi:hypothetical protein
VPSPVVAGEGVDLVDHDAADVGEPPVVVDRLRDQHRLERFGCGEQHVGRLGQEAAAFWLADVAVPEADGAADEGGVAVQALMQVVEQRP